MIIQRAIVTMYETLLVVMMQTARRIAIRMPSFKLRRDSNASPALWFKTLTAWRSFLRFKSIHSTKRLVLFILSFFKRPLSFISSIPRRFLSPWSILVREAFKYFKLLFSFFCMWGATYSSEIKSKVLLFIGFKLGEFFPLDLTPL